MNNKHPKLFRSLFNLTKNDNKIPTDHELDDDIEKLGWMMQYVWPLLRKIIREKIKLFLKYKWKRTVKYILYISVIITCLFITWNQVVSPSIVDVQHQTDTIVKEVYVTDLKSYDELVDAVGFVESGNNWGIVNEFGMMGRFQFSPGTLKGIGINVEQEYFLNDTLLQLAAFKRLLFINKQHYQKYIDKWNGKKMPQDDVIMTESGILMAFHLKPSAAIKYFESNCTDISDRDGNGTPVTVYIKKFSGYKLE